MSEKDPLITEAFITIGGYALNVGQSMSIRVAIENFASELHENGLGEDEHGKAMTKNYLNRIDELRVLISKSIREQNNE